MKPSQRDTVTSLEILGDCWIPQSKVAAYLGISERSLRRRIALGRCLPHHIDLGTGKKYWRKRRLDAELEHGNLADGVTRQAISSMRYANAIKKGLKK
jgi:hypothetical protein